MRQRRPLLALLAAAVVIPLSGAVVASSAVAANAADLSATLYDPVKREMAMGIMGTAENSTTQWHNQYDYIEAIPDHRGYTAGIVGFTTGTSDLLDLVRYYTEKVPDNGLAKWIDELEQVNNSDVLLGQAFVDDWIAEAQKPRFQQAQRDETFNDKFKPSVDMAIADGVGALGQFMYFDTMVMHGDTGLADIRTKARAKAKTPTDGGTEKAYLTAFLDVRSAVMTEEGGVWADLSRVETAQRQFLNANNLAFNPPLEWTMYTQPFSYPTAPAVEWPADVAYNVPDAPLGTLISSGRPVTASSGAALASRVVDGSLTTNWTSASGVDPQWIQVDLGAGAKVDSVVLKWPTEHAKDYKIQISDDGTTWRELENVVGSNGTTDTFRNLNGTGRYLRVHGTQRAQNESANYAYYDFYALRELEVYKTDSGTPTTSTLLSQNKPVTASSFEDVGFEAPKAVDGNATTRWASVERVDPQWLRIDLGTGAKIDRVVLKWETAYAKSYRLETSNDGTNWNPLKTVSTSDGGTDEHVGLNGAGRYLRIFGTVRGTTYGYSLFEAEVYGSIDGGGTTPTPTPTPTPTATQTPAPADVLITKNRPATASSVETVGFEADKAVDGNATSRWASAEQHDPEWIQVDLGTGAKVNKVVLKWEAAYAKAYRIETSNDGTNWNLLKAETAGNGGTDEHLTPGGAGRYLRVTGTARGTTFGYSLFELEAYGTPGEGGGNPNPGTAFTVVAAGDIAGMDCKTRGVKVDTGTFKSDCKHFETFDRAKAINPAFYITLGDMQYDDGHMEDFMGAYDKTWGTVKSKTWPVPGNHESYDDYDNLDPKAYRDYFGSRATPNGKMYYSYDYGNWHFIALDTTGFNSGVVVNDPEQLAWLEADLAATTKQCVVAYMHHPSFSSGSHGSKPVSLPFWEKLANANAELVLSGHDHNYERFAPMNASGAASSSGTVQIVSGLGGHEQREIYNVRANSVKRLSRADGKYGVSQLDFTDNTVTHKFVDIAGNVLDSNTITCH